MPAKVSNHKVVIPGDKQQTLDYCVKHWIECAKRAIHSHNAFYVALSGGSTPRSIFEILSKKEHLKDVEWKKVWLFWSDERNTLPTSDESNFRMAMDAGFSSLPIPQEHIFRMQAEENIAENATHYEETIKKHVPNACFDLIMLGMGEDGHTASLFPETEALKETKRLVVANHLTKQQTWRMTFTYPLIKRAKLTTAYVLGSSKAEMLHHIFSKKTDLPIQNIGSQENPALWILDLDSAKKLT